VNREGSRGTGAQDLFIVEGMFCAACAASLEHRLGRLPGVADVAVDLAASAALLCWEPGAADPNAAQRLIGDMGYLARRPDETARSDTRTDPARALRFDLVIALFFGMWTMLPTVVLYLDAAPDPAAAHGLAWAAALLSLPVVLIAGRPFYGMALATLRAGAPGIDALVSFGVLGAIALSAVSLAQGGAAVYFEVAVALITLQLLARLIDLRLARAGRDAMARLLDLAPARVLRLAPDGSTALLSVSAIEVGDLLVIDPGETLALDGELVRGAGAVDRHLLTGESRPVIVTPGAQLHAGEIVVDGTLQLRVTAAAGARRIDRLGRQIRTLLMRKPGWQRGIDTLARHFLVLASLAAALGAILAVLGGADLATAGTRALAVFVIACPCALSLAAPLTALCAARRAAEAGMLLRDLRSLTSASRIDLLFVDKTGTLTLGRPQVAAVHPVAELGRGEVLALAARAESRSRHPLGLALVEAARAAGQTSWPEPATRIRAATGGGVVLEEEGGTLRVGNADWLRTEGIVCPALPDSELTRVWVARGDRVLGAIDLDDPLRPGAAEAIGELAARGIEVILLSGDATGPVARVADRLGIRGEARCSPEDKVARIEAAQARGAVTAFVGDGLNDGPALAAADLGIAVEDALDAARTASAVTLVRGAVERVPALLDLTRLAHRVLRQNLVGAIAYNALAVPAALLGWVHPAVAAVAMAASSMTVVLNAQRVRAPQCGQGTRGAPVASRVRRVTPLSPNG
jgi:heavy metal translocating P-type ATPase